MIDMGFLSAVRLCEPPLKKWSIAVVRKRKTKGGHKEAQARSDCFLVTSG